MALGVMLLQDGLEQEEEFDKWFGKGDEVPGARAVRTPFARSVRRQLWLCDATRHDMSSWRRLVNLCSL